LSPVAEKKQTMSGPRRKECQAPREGTKKAERAVGMQKGRAQLGRGKKRAVLGRRKKRAFRKAAAKRNKGRTYALKEPANSENGGSGGKRKKRTRSKGALAAAISKERKKKLGDRYSRGTEGKSELWPLPAKKGGEARAKMGSRNEGGPAAEGPPAVKETFATHDKKRRKRTHSKKRDFSF